VLPSTASASSIPFRHGPTARVIGNAPMAHQRPRRLMVVMAMAQQERQLADGPDGDCGPPPGGRA
jgi:hypothetical protein